MSAFIGKHVSRLLSESQGGILSHVPPMEDHLSRFFVQATIILGICRALSLVGSYLGQPRVIFEIIGGILLGPSAIGRNADYLEQIFPSSSLGYLGIVANIGLTFYLFLVGLELDPKLLATHARKAGGIAIIGMAVPFALGVAISKVMFDVLQGSDPAYKDVSFVSFFVFVGTAMSITAFPVLARILKEGGLIYTKAGAMTMGAAALNDAIAWCLLTLAISIANAGNMAIAGYVFLTVAAFALGLLFIIRPIFEYLVEYVENLHSPAMNNNLFAFTICILFMCAWTTALLGVHAIFGAFLFGLIVPRGSHLFKECIERIEEFVVTVTLPLYFALSGLKTDVSTIHTAEEGEITILVCVVATLGKFIGAGGTAYVSGMTLRESSVVAVLMNTRGLVELIVLNLGMESGILSTRTFSVMVVMCLVTTFLTCPLVEFIYPLAMRTRVVEEEEDADEGNEGVNKPNRKSVRSGSEKNAENKTDEPGSGKGGEGSPHSNATDEDYAGEEDEDIHDQEVATMLHIAKEAHVGIVIDKLTQMQPLLKLLVYLLPHSLHSELSVTAVHTIEPTNSTKDEFLPLNEDGKLIRIDEETTDFATALHDMDDPAAKKPELLPLSMFCRAVNTAINAFRVQGDPNEFPSVVKKIYKANDCDFTLIPWRPGSDYAAQLLYSVVQMSHVPVVLFVSMEQFWSHQQQHHHNLGMDSVVNSGRNRSNSNAAHHPANVNFINDSSDKSPAVRQRGNSIFVPHFTAHPHPAATPTSSAQPPLPLPASLTPHHHMSYSALDEDDEEAHNTVLYSTVPATIQAQHRRAHVTNQMRKVASKKKTCSMVLSILTGTHLDVSVLALLLRMAENPLHHVYVMIPQDYATFPLLHDVLTSFQHHVQAKHHVKCMSLQAITSDVEELVRESLATMAYAQSAGPDHNNSSNNTNNNTTHHHSPTGHYHPHAEHFDVFVSAFVAPPSTSSDSHDTADHPHHAPASEGSSRVHRSATLTEVIVGSLGVDMHSNGNATQSQTHAHHASYQTKYAQAGLTYPELGVLGHQMLCYSEHKDGVHAQYTRSSKMLIVHESEKLGLIWRARAETVASKVTVARPTFATCSSSAAAVSALVDKDNNDNNDGREAVTAAPVEVEAVGIEMK